MQTIIAAKQEAVSSKDYVFCRFINAIISVSVRCGKIWMNINGGV